MPTTTIRVDADLLQRIEVAKPSYLSTAGFFQLLADEALTGRIDETTKGPLQPSKGTLTTKPAVEISERSEEQPYKEVSLRAEEAHVPAEVLAKKPRTPRSTGTNARLNGCIANMAPQLLPHEDLIREFWPVKSGSKGERAFKLLETGLREIQDAYGDRAVRGQLELAINGKWQSITLANYEKFGLPRGNAPTQANDSSRFAHLTGMSI